MRKPSTRKITTAPTATVKAAKTAVAKAATAARATIAAPTATVPAIVAETAIVAPTVAAPAVAKPSTSTGLTRDAAGIVRAATNYGTTRDRDIAYLAFFGNTMRANGGKATLAQIRDAGVRAPGAPESDRKRYNPLYAGSAKATDIGAINRLVKAGYLTRNGDGSELTATPLAVSSKAYATGAV